MILPATHERAEIWPRRMARDLELHELPPSAARGLVEQPHAGERQNASARPPFSASSNSVASLEQLPPHRPAMRRRLPTGDEQKALPVWHSPTLAPNQHPPNSSQPTPPRQSAAPVCQAAQQRNSSGQVIHLSRPATNHQNQIASSPLSGAARFQRNR